MPGLLRDRNSVTIPKSHHSEEEWKCLLEAKISAPVFLGRGVSNLTSLEFPQSTSCAFHIHSLQCPPTVEVKKFAYNRISAFTVYQSIRIVKPR